MSAKLSVPAPGQEPTPLDKYEIIAVVGAGMIAVGVFCPAISLGATRSFFATGNTVAAVVLGLAGATIWSIAMRQSASVMWNGLLSLLIAAIFGIAIWNDEVREPMRTFFGPIQSEFRPTSWLLIGIGAAVVTLAGYLARRFGGRNIKPLTSTQSMAIAGLVLATLGCLFGIAMTNPFSPPMSSGSLREIGRSWHEQLNIVRWLLITGSVCGVILSVQVPRLADQSLRIVTGITWFIVGNALFISLSPKIGVSLYLGVVWNFACIGLLLWKMNTRQTWTWWECLVYWFPYLAAGVLLLVMGAFDHLIFGFAPPAAATAVGYMICRSPKWASKTAVAAMLVLGIPAAILAFGGVPNEYLEPCDLSSSEGRVLLLALVGILAWAILLSFSTTPTNTRVRKCDTTLRRPDELDSDSDAAS